MIALDAAQHGGDIFRVWHSRRNCAELLFFGVCGMMLVSYSYFASIRYGNAAAATSESVSGTGSSCDAETAASSA